MYTYDTPEVRRAWWSELGMNRIVNRMTFQIHPQGVISPRRLRADRQIPLNRY
jgi:hypothetical protein